MKRVMEWRLPRPPSAMAVRGVVKGYKPPLRRPVVVVVEVEEKTRTKETDVMKAGMMAGFKTEEEVKGCE